METSIIRRALDRTRRYTCGSEYYTSPDEALRDEMQESGDPAWMHLSPFVDATVASMRSAIVRARDDAKNKK